MSLVNYTAREITCKIVYYGPGRSGKTTNLQYVYGRVPESRRGRMVSLATQTDRTLFFDFLPLDLGSISGFTTKFQLYTVPGQIYYNATRKLVLQGADGVVFVADSQARRFDENMESLQDLQDNLLAQGVDVRQVPLVFQYNKQDLPRDLILTHEEMDDALNFRAVPSYSGRRAPGRSASSRRCAASRSWCSSAWRRGRRSRDRHAQSPLPLRHLRGRRRPTAWPSPPPRPSPNRRARSTTRSSSTPSPGLGKTHLLMGLGHAARGINPSLVVEYLTLDEFVEAFHAAIAAGHGEAYRKRFLDVDLLLVDDVQFLTHRREMQAELLRLTDALQAGNRQIVLTSDRPPAEIEALDERLIRRFAGGLIVDIAAPDYETRVAILRRKARSGGSSFGDGVLEAVAGLAIDNVRELLGALNRLIAFQSVSDAADQPGAGAAPDRGSRGPAGGRGAVGGRRLTPPGGNGVVPVADEFSDFLSEITATVAQQVDAWRTQIEAAALRWEGEGYRTGRLQASAGAGDRGRSRPRARRSSIRTWSGCATLEAEAIELAPDLAGHAAFRDPADVPAAHAAARRAPARARHPPPAPSPLWRLDELVEDRRQPDRASRRALTIAKEPGTRYNPLVIVGPSGSGKTHLLHAHGQRARRNAASSRSPASAPRSSPAS